MGKAVEIILKTLQSGAEMTATLIDAVLVGPAAVPRPSYRMKYEAIRFKRAWAELYRRRQSFYSLLNQLKREGLIKKKQPGRSFPWRITSRGRERLTKILICRFRNASRREIVLPKKKYVAKTQKSFVIVAFDVPERERKLRDWLRSHLVSFGFTRLQKSVWAGNHGIPEEFAYDLKDLGMLPYVQIFAITKRGTIQEVAIKKA